MICLAFILVGIPSAIRPLATPDEGRYAEVSRLTLAEGNWMYPYLNNVPHLTKPPLFYDLTAAAMKIFGANRFSARIISVAAFILILLLAAKKAEKFGGKNAHIIFALIYLSMLQQVFVGQFGDLNMTLTFFLAAGLLFIFDGLSQPDRRAAFYIGWMMLGLGFLTKGPPAIIIPAGTLVMYKFCQPKPSKLRILDWEIGIILFLIIALPWYFWVLYTDKNDVLKFWFGNIFRRTGVHKGSQSPLLFFLYIPVFYIGSSLWGAFMTARFIKSYKKSCGAFSTKKMLAFFKEKLASLSDFEKFLFSWIAFTFLIFSLLRSSMVSYIQPLYPPFALFAAIYISKRRDAGELDFASIKMIARISLIITFLAVYILSFGLYFAVENPPDPKTFTLKTFEIYLVADKLKEMQNDEFDMAQYGDFYALFNFYARRSSLLCKTDVHKEFDNPESVDLTDAELKRRIDSNNPLVIITKKDKLKNLKPEQYKNLHPVFERKYFMIFKNY